MKVLSLYNIKGGVGKTSTAVNLGHLAAQDGLRTLLWDLDPQGAATYLFRVRPKVKGGAGALVAGRRTLDDAVKQTDHERLDLLPADFSYRNLDLDLDAHKHPGDRLRRLIRRLEDEYDLVVLDCPPSASLVSENVLHASDVLLVPLIPAVLSLRTYDQLIEFVAQLRRPRPVVLAFLSMVDRRKKAHRELAAELPARRADVLPAVVPNLSVIEQMAVRRAPVTEYATRGPAGSAYRELWDQVRSALQL
jgi:cellulose biosynthesis protein BcsQ